MKKATKLAKRLYKEDRDKYHLGQAFIYLKNRNKLFEELLHSTDHYMRFGMGSNEFNAMRVAVKHLREMEEEKFDDSSSRL